MSADISTSDPAREGVPLPDPVPVKKPSRRGTAIALAIAIALIGTAVLAAVLAALWAVPVFTDGTSSVTSLGPGDSVAIANTDFVVTVPEGWSGRAEDMPQRPAWAGGGPIARASDGLRQAVSLESRDCEFRFLVFTDDDAWTAHKDLVMAGSEAADIEGSTFDAGDWTVRTYPEREVLLLLTDDDSGVDPMYVTVASKADGVGMPSLAATLDELVTD